LVAQKVIKMPQIIEGSNVFIGGEDYENSIFKKELPDKIFYKLYNDYNIIFPESISGPDKNLYDISVSQMVKQNKETRLVEEINWQNRYQLLLGAFNDANYNAYGNQQPERKKLPFFVKYTFPKEYINSESKFCWQGLAYYGAELTEKHFEKINCKYLSQIEPDNANKHIIWLLETGKGAPLKAKLEIPFKYKIKMLVKNLITFLSSMSLLFLLFKNINLKKSFYFILSFVISVAFAIYFYPNVLNKLILLEGGNDGLLYVHFAHLISDNISNANYALAFMGGEKAYDLMPFYRYIWVANYLFFGESPWMLYFILTFFPLVIFKVFELVLNKKWANYFLLFWFLVPIFEAFGFFHFYYVKLTLRGFGEPLAYLLYLSGLIIMIKFYKEGKINYTNSFILGLAISLTIGLRANILPACFVLIVFFLLKNNHIKEFKNTFFLSLGLSLTLIIPFHNYYFTNDFIPLTIAAYKDWNLGARPSDYYNLLVSLLNFNFDYILWKKIVSHVSGEIKLYEFWYHISIITSIFYLVRIKSPMIIRCISLASLSLVILLFFYHVGGRYSYLTWTLTLLVFSYWLKNDLLPYLIKIINKHVN